MSRPQETKNGPGATPPSKRTGAVAPADTNQQGHENLMPHVTAADTPVGLASGPDLPTAADIIRDAMGHRLRAEELLLAADPVAVELHELGFRLGVQHGERCAGERAAQEAAHLLAYIAEDPQATPGPIPPLERPHRHLGVAA